MKNVIICLLVLVILLIFLNRASSSFVDSSGIAWPCPTATLNCPNPMYSASDVGKKCSNPHQPSGYGVVTQLENKIKCA